MAANPYGRGVVGLLKQAWHEIPGVSGTTVMALIGLGLGIKGCKSYIDNQAFAPTYKKTYTVYRPDDPRVNRPTHDWV